MPDLVWRTSWPYRAVFVAVVLGLAGIAAAVLLGGRTEAGDLTGDVVVLSCVVVLAALGALPTLRPRARLTVDRLQVRNALSAWELPLDRIAVARPNVSGAVEVVDDEGRTRGVAVASGLLLEALVGIDHRAEFLDALAARGVSVERDGEETAPL